MPIQYADTAIHRGSAQDLVSLYGLRNISEVTLFCVMEFWEKKSTLRHFYLYLIDSEGKVVINISCADVFFTHISYYWTHGLLLS